MKKNDHMHAAKNFLAFMIVAIAASMFLVFYNNQESILRNGSFQLFMTLVVIGAGFLVGLLYLINNTTNNASKKTPKTSSRSKKKR